MRFRDAALSLARTAPFAQRMINSGRLSTPAIYDTPLSTPDMDSWQSAIRTGAVAPDAPVKDASGREAWLLSELGRSETLLVFPGGGAMPQIEGLHTLVVGRDLEDHLGVATKRLDASPGSAFLFRPDHVLAARWRKPEREAIMAALRRLRGQELTLQ